MGIALLRATATGEDEGERRPRSERGAGPEKPRQRNHAGEAEEAPDPPGHGVADKMEQRAHGVPAFSPPGSGRRSSTDIRRVPAEEHHHT